VCAERERHHAAQEDTEEGARSNRVLVMCPSGMSASATVLASYLICKRRVPLAVCMAKLREAHPAVEPNKGFARHLRFLERNGELPEWSKP
jgi:protein-tyrosine phosphatase